MLYSIINVREIDNKSRVHGSLMQDHIGTLETAKDAARTTHKANGNKLTIAVVAKIPGEECIGQAPFALFHPTR